MLDGVRQYRRDHVDVRAQLRLVGHVYPERQRGANHWIVGDGPQGLLHELLREREARPDMDAESQVGAHAPERRRSMEVSTREVEAISRLQHRLHKGRFFSPFLNISFAVAPSLIAQRRRQDRGMNAPTLLPVNLQNKDVVHVVVGAEPLILWRRHVRVGLHRMAELGGEPLAELQNAPPGSMQGLEHKGRAVRKETDQLVLAHLVSDTCSNATRRGEGFVGEGRPIFGDPQEWRPQTPLRYELVDRIRIEQFCNLALEIGGRGQQWLLTPELTRELVAVDGHQSSEG